MDSTSLSDAVALARLHSAIRAALDSRTAAAQDELERVEAERAQLDKAEEMYKRMGVWPTGPHEPPPSPSAGHAPTSERVAETAQPRAKQPRARFGPKRYRVLVAIRSFGTLSPAAIAVKTGLPLRRVKDQLSNEIDIGILELDGDGFALTPIGSELLSRFENDKRRAGIRLPAFDDASTDEDHEDGESEEHSEEEVNAM